jgi:hypothetical protein
MIHKCATRPCEEHYYFIFFNLCVNQMSNIPVHVHILIYEWGATNGYACDFTLITSHDYTLSLWSYYFLIFYVHTVYYYCNAPLVF